MKFFMGCQIIKNAYVLESVDFLLGHNPWTYRIMPEQTTKTGLKLTIQSNLKTSPFLFRFLSVAKLNRTSTCIFICCNRKLSVYY